MSERKLTDQLLIVKGVSQKASKILIEALTGSEHVQIRVHPTRPMVTSALVLHSVLAQKGYVVETAPSLSQPNSNHSSKGEVKIELSISNKTAPKSANLIIRSGARSDRYTLPYNQATQTVFFFLAEEVSIATDEMRAVTLASVLQHEIVPQDPDSVQILKNMGLHNYASKYLSIAYAKGFSIVDSLVSTLKPFLPNISLEDPEAIAGELRARGIDPSESVHDMDEQKLKQVVSYVSEKVALSTRFPVQLQKIIQSVYASEGFSRREYDLRTLAGMLDVLIEVNPVSILTALVHRDLRIIESAFNVYSQRLRETVKKALQSRSVVASGSRVLILEGVELPAPLSYVRDNLTAYGILQHEDAILVRRDSKPVANCFVLAEPCKIALKPIDRREEWCYYNVESEEIAKYL